MVDEAKLTKAFVGRKILQLSQSVNDSATRATLANLRRGIGKAPLSMPELWDITLNGLPEELMSVNEQPTRSEKAIYVALTLYALHQQGKDIKHQCMSRDGESLGASIRKLVKSDEEEQRVKRRFDAAATADSLEEFAHHLRGLVQLLKAQDIPLDYPALAQDLYRFQFPESRDSVRLRWGQDYFRYRTSNKTEEQENK